MESSLRLGSWHRWRGTYHRWFRSAVKYCSERHMCSLSGSVIKRLVEMSSVCSSRRSPTSAIQTGGTGNYHCNCFHKQDHKKISRINQKQKSSVSCAVFLLRFSSEHGLIGWLVIMSIIFIFQVFLMRNSYQLGSMFKYEISEDRAFLNCENYYSQKYQAVS